MATAAGPSPGPSRPQTPGRQLTPSGSGTGQTSTSGSLQDVSTGAKSELGGLDRIVVCLECRTWRSFSRWEVLYTLFNLAILMTLTALSVYTVLIQQADNLVMTCFAFICEAFAYVYLLTSVFCERPCEVGCFKLTYILMAYTITVNYIMEPHHPVKLAELCVIWTFFLPVMVLNVIFVFRFLKGSRVVTRIVGKGADSDVKQGLIWMFRCRALIPLDLQLTAMTLLYSFHDEAVFHTMNYLVVLSLGGLFASIYLVLGMFTIRLEKLFIFILFFIFSFLQPAYVFYVIGHSYVEIMTLSEAPEMVEHHIRNSVTIAVLGYCAVFLLTRIALVTCMERVQNLYGNGIGQLMFNYSCLFPQKEATGNEPLLPDQQPPVLEQSLPGTYSTFGSGTPTPATTTGN